MSDKDYIVSIKAKTDGSIESIEKINESVAKTEATVKSAKQQLRELNTQLSSLEQGSEEFNRVSQAAGQLRDQIGDAAEAIRANAGNSVEVLSNNVGNLGNQFANLDFEGITSSFQGISGAIGRVDLKSLTAGIGQAGTAFAQVGKALLTNPIFLIGGAIAALVLSFDKIKEVLDIGVNPATRRLAEETRAAAEASKAAFEAFDLEERRLRALGVAEDEIAAKRKQATEDRLAQLRKDLIVQKDILKQQIAEFEKSGGVGLGLFGPSLDDIKEAQKRVAEIEKEEAELAVRVLEIDKKITDDKKQELDKQQADADKAAADRKAKREKDNQDQLKKEQEKNKALVDANLKRIADEDAAFALRQELLLNEQQKEIAARVKVFEEQQLAAGNDAELQKLAREKLQTDLAAINKKYSDADLVKQQEAAAKKIALDQQIADLRLALIPDSLQKQEDAEVAAAEAKYAKLLQAAKGDVEATKALEELKQKELDAIKESYDQKEKARRRQNLENNVKLTMDAFGAINDLIQAFGKEDEKSARKKFQINKAFNLASAVTNTALAVTGALSGGGNPAKIASGQNFVEAGIAAALGLAQIAKIASTKFESTGGGGGGGGNIPAPSSAGGANNPSVPTFNPVNTSFLQNRPQQAIPAYVLSGAVTNAQVADQQIQDRSRL